MAWLKRSLHSLFAHAENVLEGIFGPDDNPMTSLGALGWFFFWIAAATGIYLYIFFDTGITNAYASVEYMTNDQWYAAGIMRSLHRYSSDALVIVAVLHMLREFAADRLRGKRFFAWITGLPVLGLIYICGISGYWLVWDQLAQYIAIASTEWLDTLPFFGEPVANNFLDSSTLSDRFFTLMVFIHIFVPLFTLLLLWVHVQRHARAKVNPSRPLMIGTGTVLLVLSLVYPATSHPPADLDLVPTTLDFDWYYLVAYPLLDVMPGGYLWLALFGTFVLLMLLPWMPKAPQQPSAVVSLDNCNGCARCFDDCPFSAITMEMRSDGSKFELEAVVNRDNCVSCGICVGACPTSTPFRRAQAIVPGIELPDHRIADLRQRTVDAFGELEAELGVSPRILVYACAQAGAEALSGESVRVIDMPCVAMLPPAFVDFVLSRSHADGVMLAGCARGDCHFRLGDEWVRQRVAGRRDPYLRNRVPRDRLRLSWLRSTSAGKRRQQLEAFVAALEVTASTEVGRTGTDA